MKREQMDRYIETEQPTDEELCDEIATMLFGVGIINYNRKKCAYDFSTFRCQTGNARCKTT